MSDVYGLYSHTISQCSLALYCTGPVTDNVTFQMEYTIHGPYVISGKSAYGLSEEAKVSTTAACRLVVAQLGWWPM